MAEHWLPTWETSKEAEPNGFDEPYVPSVPFVPRVSLPFFDDERDLLDAEGWDDLETAA